MSENDEKCLNNIIETNVNKFYNPSKSASLSWHNTKRRGYDKNFSFLKYIWKEFSQLNEALKCIDSEKNLRIFAREIVKFDRPVFSYILTNINTFWYEYSVLDEYERHFYELIIKEKPCKLYLDLEFEYEFNQNLNGISMTHSIIELIIKMLGELDIIVDNHDFIWLDSSSNIKYSAHIIMNKYCFNSNKHISYFMERCIERAIENKLDLFIKKRNNISSFFSDMSVYSNNRCFRLYLSSKISKKIPLKLSSNSLFRPQVSESNNIEKDIFVATLIVPSNENYPIIQIYPEQSIKSITSKQKSDNNYNNDYFTTLVENEIRNIFGQNCFIKLWGSYPSMKYIRYSLSGSRFCFNINRQHKSNHIYLILDLITMKIYQKCYDPDCSSFISPPLVDVSYLNNISCNEYPMEPLDSEIDKIADAIDRRSNQ